MRTIIILLFLTLPAFPQMLQGIVGGTKPAAGGEWTLVQHVNKANCGGQQNCTATVSSTGAGHLLVAIASAYQTTSAITFSAISGDSTWTHCPAGYLDHNYSGSTRVATDCAYILSATGGATSIQWTWSASASNYFSLEVMEFAWSGSSISYDTGNVGTDTTCTSCNGQALTLTGAKDVVIQWAVPGGPNITSVDAGWSTNADIDANGYGFAHKLNISSFSVPVWAVPSTTVGVGAVAFKGI